MVVFRLGPMLEWAKCLSRSLDEALEASYLGSIVRSACKQHVRLKIPHTIGNVEDVGFSGQQGSWLIRKEGFLPRFIFCKVSLLQDTSRGSPGQAIGFTGSRGNDSRRSSNTRSQSYSFQSPNQRRRRTRSLAKDVLGTAIRSFRFH